MNAVQPASFDMKGRAVIVVQTGDIRTHHGERLHDTPHGAFLNGSVSGQRRFEGLRRKNAGNQAGCRTAVACIEYDGRGLKSVKALAVNQDSAGRIFDFDAQTAETFDGRETVGSL